MTRVDSTAWVLKAKKRKAYRDHYRDKFFAEVGLKKQSHEMDIQGAPQSQRLQVVRLMNLTRKGALASGHATQITEMAKILGSVGLGKGEMGSAAKLQVDLDQYTMKKLRAFFYSPAFFD